MQEFDPDLNSPAFIFNPYAQLNEFREKMPIFYSPRWNKVFFSRYEDIAVLLKDRRLGRSMEHPTSHEAEGVTWLDPIEAPFHFFNSNALMDREPPDHTRLKGLVAKVFSPQRIEGLRGKIELTVNRLIDAGEAQGKMDLHQDYAEPLPVIIIGELLGVPRELCNQLRLWSAAIVKGYELGYTREQMQEASQAVVEFSDLIRRIAHDRRAHPQEDLITALVQVESQGERLSEDELICNCILLLNAGHEATVNATTAGMLSLFRNPAQFTWLKAQAAAGNAAAFKPAIEEMLRYDTPLPMFERWVLADLTCGIELERGMEVALLYASGNRDPRRFERPDELNLTRKDNPHLTFGLGTHYCLGAPLARLEMQISFQTLLQRLPNIRLAIPDGEVPYTGGFVIRGIRSLPVIW